ncbi:MAG: DinB family protein [Bryobacterales bacterium]|nr:DinB family protein [Bryobacterales bacterium]
MSARALKRMWVAVALLWLAGSAPAAPMTALERQRLVAHLEMTGAWLSEELAGLTSGQLRFKPAPQSWSILEVLEHLVIAEPVYWQDLRRAMRAPAGKRPAGTDADVLWYGIDRTQRQKAVPAEDIKGTLRDARQGLEEFRRLRSRMLEYARTTSEDLRAHIVPREGSDAYQWLLLISAHCQRHILQVREIKADPKFPKQ